ncbi:MAG: hypothetical protein JSU70_09410 [Phycisphaerales bacterium]|nr:MAG: hypothetical protein JSU70_09410 [Phycisphaerales bacterium]
MTRACAIGLTLAPPVFYNAIVFRHNPEGLFVPVCLGKREKPLYIRNIMEIWSKRVVLLGLAGLLLASASDPPVVDLDLFHELALIREALLEGSIPRADVFSYVPTVEPTVHHEWGTGALLYLITVRSGLGAAGLILTKLALVAAIGVGCYLFAKRGGAGIAVIGPLAIIATILASMAFTNVRAQLFTLLFLVALLLFLQEDQSGKRWWIGAWLPLYVVWINLHGGATVGLFLVTLYGFERLVAEVMGGASIWTAFRQVRHLAIVAGLMMALTLVNPYGAGYLSYVWRAVSMDRAQWVPEWFPMWKLRDPGSLSMIPLFILSLIIAAYSVNRSRQYRAPGVLFLLAAAWQAIVHFRHLSIYAVAWICITPAYLENTGLGRAMKATWENKRRVLTAIWAIILIFTFGCAIWRKFWHLRIPAVQDPKWPVVYPVGAVDYFEQQAFRGNVMVPFEVGAYVSWKLHPNIKVSVDSRFEAAYPVEWVVEVAMCYAGRNGWRETLTRYPTDAVLAPRGGPLENLLEQSSDETTTADVVSWRKAYVDDGYSVFVRAEMADRLPFVNRTGKQITGSFP